MSRNYCVSKITRSKQGSNNVTVLISTYDYQNAQRVFNDCAETFHSDDCYVVFNSSENIDVIDGKSRGEYEDSIQKHGDSRKL